jgi:DNA repair protein RecO (recombination protein O)
MALVKSRAISLKSYRLGETSKVVVCYTRNYGKVRLVAKGARKGGGRLGAALEPMLVSGVVFYLREGRGLLLVSQADVERQWPELRRDVVRMAYAGAALELTDALVSEREPDPGLFDLLEDSLDRAAAAPPSSLDMALWNFELSLASALGYAPELARCIVCGGPLAGRASFAARRGGIVCGDCLGEEPGARPLSDSAAKLLASMSPSGGETPPELGSGKPGHASGKPVAPSTGTPAPPSTGTPASQTADIPTAVRDEISETLMGFLEEHAGRELRLKSLEFLAQIRRTGQPSAQSEQRHEG